MFSPSIDTLLADTRPPRVRLAPADRLLWVWLSRVWKEWRAALVIVKPETVIALAPPRLLRVLELEESSDFFVMPTVTGRLLFVLVILAHERRRIVHVAVTEHPTAAWTAQQLREGELGTKM
jgi:hypothetical protein